MTDPREAKLPKWAQDALASARRRADLAWPSMPKPEPYCVADVNGHTTGKDPKGRTLYKVFGGFHGAMVESANIDNSRHIVRGDGGFGQRMQGEFYATRSDAILAAWWRECEASATAIHNQAEAYRRATGGGT